MDNDSTISQENDLQGTCMGRGDCPGQCGCLGPGRRSGAGQRSDGQIEMDVVHALDGSAQLKNDLITAATIQSEVTLSGTVATDASKKLAESLASQVPGVTKVHNNLKGRRPAAGPTPPIPMQRSPTTRQITGRLPSRDSLALEISKGRCSSRGSNRRMANSLRRNMGSNNPSTGNSNRNMASSSLNTVNSRLLRAMGSSLPTASSLSMDMASSRSSSSIRPPLPPLLHLRRGPVTVPQGTLLYFEDQRAR